jgi:membrane-associated phospholipid phosphatase
MDWKDKFSVVVPVLGLGTPVVGLALTIASLGGCGAASSKGDRNDMVSSPVAWLLLLVAAVMSNLGAEVLKRIAYTASSGAAFSRRPPNAFACDSFACTGEAGGRPGFPSGHGTIVGLYAAVLVALALCSPSGETSSSSSDETVAARFGSVVFAVVAGLVLILVNAHVRIAKGCHTFTQVMVGTLWGALFGVALAFALYYYARRYRSSDRSRRVPPQE